MMTTTILQRWQHAFDATVQPNPFSLRRRGPARWTFQVSGRSRRRGSVVLEDDWLSFTLPLITNRTLRSSLPDLCRLLECNTQLPPATKFAVDPRRPRILLAAELPLEMNESPEWLAARVQEMLHAFQRGARLFESHATDVRIGQEHQPDGMVADATEIDGIVADASEDEDRFIQLCRDCGWPFVERSSGRIAVELEVPDDFYQAFIEDAGRRGLRVWVDLPQDERLCETSRRAVALLLLAASGLVRYARAAISPQSAGPTYRWEVVFDDPSTPAEMSEALAALSTACRICGREFQALQEKSVAQQYLAMRGWSS